MDGEPAGLSRPLNPLPALRDAVYDRDLSTMEKAIYFLLIYELDIQTFLEVKQAYVAVRCGVSRPAVSQALGKLVEAGYIETLTVPGQMSKYRLVYARLRVSA